VVDRRLGLSREKGKKDGENVTDARLNYTLLRVYKQTLVIIGTDTYNPKLQQ